MRFNLNVFATFIGLLFFSLNPCFSQTVDPEYLQNLSDAPPAEFMEGYPIYSDSEPSIPYYPTFVDWPGSCNCIMPIRFSNGYWYGLGSVPIYRGYFAFHRAHESHREVWRRDLPRYTPNPFHNISHEAINHPT